MPAIDATTYLPLLYQAASFHANRIARILQLSVEERNDVFHGILADLLAGLGRHDAARAALSTFISLLARHSAYGFIRRYHRWCREIPAGASPHYGPIIFSDVDDGRQSAATDSDEGDGADDVDPTVAIDIAVDVGKAIAGLSVDLRNICRLLQYHDPTDARRASGLSHATFYRRVQRIREQFVARGLDVYA
jgi:hypothetical protein